MHGHDPPGHLLRPQHQRVERQRMDRVVDHKRLLQRVERAHYQVLGLEVAGTGLADEGEEGGTAGGDGVAAGAPKLEEGVEQEGLIFLGGRGWGGVFWGEGWVGGE